MTTLPVLNIAQTFLVSNSLSPNNTTIGITSVNVYFKYKPGANNNQSGINNPGITLYLCPTKLNIPIVTANTLNYWARCEYNKIIASSTAFAPTKFSFNTPVPVSPGSQYAIVLSFDGNEQFEPWTAVDGQWIVGTRNIYSDSGQNFVGYYYEAGTINTNGVQGGTGPSQQFNWTPVVGTQLSFDVNAARYYINGVPVSQSNTIQVNNPIIGTASFESWNTASNTFTISFPSKANEGIAFNLATSTVQQYIGAQRCYQNTISYPGGYANGSSNVTISVVKSATGTGGTGSLNQVTANANLPNGTAFNWNTIFPVLNGNQFIIVNDPSGINVRLVTSIPTNTVCYVDEPFTFTNNIATFMVAPVGTVDSTLTSSPLGSIDQFLFLTGSSANATVRFVNNTILSITPTSGVGSGYNNSDILYIKGYENVAGKVTGGYVAVANIGTNATGGITNIYLSNLGCGFVNATNIVAVVANSTNVGNTTSNSSAGSGATFTYSVGATLLTEMTNNIFQNCVVSNFNVDDLTPIAQIQNPVGTTYNLDLKSQYYLTLDNSTYSGFAYYVQSPTTVDITLGKLNSLILSNPVCFISYSNEFVTPYSNGATNNLVTAGLGYSNSIVIDVNMQNIILDDYIAVQIQSSPAVEFGHYIINNSYTNENTNHGNAWARHITTLINFNQIAEDLRVYLTVYQPVNTSFQVYAKIQNTNDPESFNNEDWTRLVPVSGQGLTSPLILGAGQVLSSTTDTTDYVELGFGFPQYPNTSFTVAGAVTTTNNSTTVTGSGTLFQSNATANIVANNLVKIYNPLFANTDYVIAAVTAVGSDTTLTLDQAITSNVNIGGNPALVASGLAMDVIGYPYQGFNNINNDNVVRYYNSSITKYDGYNIMQLKIVMLSSAYSYIPQINSIRLLGVSA